MKREFRNSQLGVPSFVSAQVVINEIAWMGGPVEGVDSRQEWRYEWLELYNAGDTIIALDDWEIELYREKLDFEIFLHGTMKPEEYFVVAASNRLPVADMEYGSLAGKFVNAGQRVVLKNAAGTVVEEIDASGGWFGGDNDTKVTMERRFLEREANDPENWGSSQKTGGTPKAKNSLFGKERFVQLVSPGTGSFLQQKTRRTSLFSTFDNPALFMRAFLIAVLASVLILLLRRHLLRRHLLAE